MAYRTIEVKKWVPKRDEKVAAGAITPGFLLELDSAGKVQAHSTAEGTAHKIFAVEDDLQGKEISQAYSTGDVVQVCYADAGDEIYALIADGEDIAIGDYLVSNGDGYLKEASTADSAGVLAPPASVVAVALEALDMSGSTGEDPSSQRCLVSIL